ncbi:MAG: peptidoglycan-binding protein [Methylocystis sp.]|nr:MAG: peptidoglycan-binding protein [Methylocystis sp.]
MRDASLSAPKLQGFPDERAAPRRRTAAPPPAPSRAPKKKKSVLARVFGAQRMGFLLLLAIGGLAFVGVPMNALFFQDGRHPAPLFTTHTPAAVKDDVAANAPATAERPAKMEAASAEPDTVKSAPVKPESAGAPSPKAIAKKDSAALKDLLKPEPAPARLQDKPQKKKPETANRDAIGALLGGGAAARTAAAHAAAPPAAGPDKNILAAQRNLLRLGYVVKPDGAMSAGTRQAIEKFERDNGLPPKGELSAKVLKALSARAAQ